MTLEERGEESGGLAGSDAGEGRVVHDEQSGRRVQAEFGVEWLGGVVVCHGAIEVGQGLGREEHGRSEGWRVTRAVPDALDELGVCGWVWGWGCW